MILKNQFHVEKDTKEDGISSFVSLDYLGPGLTELANAYGQGPPAIVPLTLLNVQVVVPQLECDAEIV
jgi:hypothetical protein